MLPCRIDAEQLHSHLFCCSEVALLSASSADNGSVGSAAHDWISEAKSPTALLRQLAPSLSATCVQATRHLNLNSGLFYLQANERTVSLMSRIAARLAREKAWDQSVFNEEIFFLSHDDYVSPNISVRVMNIFKFLNSKVRQHIFLASLCAITQ